MRENDRQRPYAAPANVFSVLQRLRSRNLPERIDDDLLRLAGVPEGAMHRVHTAYRFLGLVNEDSTPTDALRSLAAAPQEQYRQTLEGLVRAAYQEDFERIEPGQDTQAQIVDAFRIYQPRSQTNRMVTLFLALCREAGIPVMDAPRERMQQPAAARTRRAPSSAASRGTQRQGAQKQRAQDEQAPGEILFGLTEEDVAVLGETEFNEVWTALGKVARARARAKHQPESESPAREGTDDTASEEDEL
jgi:hypothetical protein